MDLGTHARSTDARARSLSTELLPVRSHEHAAHFYEDDAELVQVIADYLAEPLRSGSIAIVIATPEHRIDLAAALARAGVDAERAQADGLLKLLDAAQTLARFESDGAIDAAAFERVIGGTVHAAVRSGRPLVAFGEMVALLWEAGNVLGAIELEGLWNELQQEADFTLLCGYRSASVQGEACGDGLADVCRLHSALRGDEATIARTRAPGDTEVSCWFAADPRSVRAARMFVVDALRDRGYERPLLDDAKLVASELATNAIVHASARFELTARLQPGGVRLSVDDSSHLEPIVREADPAAPAGRGLPLIAALSSSWGVELRSAGKTVWAELAA